jgi:asparagine N-glycosylation enzyme membrane subunit Stt3
MFLEGEEASINKAHRERLAEIRKEILALSIEREEIKTHEREEEELAHRQAEEDKRVRFMPAEEAEKLRAMHIEEEKKLITEHEKEERIILSSIKPGRIKRMDLIFIIAAIAVMCVLIYYRAPMLDFYGFYEPDGYFHFSMIRAAVDNGFTIPQYLSISGWPYYAPRPPHHEPFGLYWVTLIPYMFLQYAGINYYTVMRLIPMFFGILDAIGAYLLARYLSKDRLFGLLVMLFVALNMGNAARTSALIYRGDSFVTAFFIFALICTAEMFRSTDKRKKIMFMLASGFLLSLCNLVWSGAAFATAIYIFSFILILVLGYTFKKKEMVHETKYMLGALLFWSLLVSIYKATEFIVSTEAFTGVNFFLLYAMMIVGWYLTEYISDNEKVHIPYAETSYGRFGISIAVIFIAFLIIYMIIPSFVSDIFLTSGFLPVGSFATTIQELQPPNYPFLFASFGLQNFANPMSIIMILATYASNLNLLFWLLLLISLIPYFYMHVEKDGEGILSGNVKFHFEFDENLLILISYFALTAYLQMSAIRFNSLLSIPVSIISAFTIYWFMCLTKKYKYAYYASYLLMVLLIVYMMKVDSTYTSGLSPADQINPLFLQAMSWLKSNSASNSVVLTLWPDGSVVEGVANRTSITDSVGSQHASAANPFAAWLYNSSPDPGFLLSNISGKPDYLVVRGSWMYETGGIFTESGINVSSSSFGYNPFSSLDEKVNQSVRLFQFFGSNLEEDTVITNRSGNQTVASYLKLQNGIQPFEYVDFYNEITGDFSIIKQTAFNVTNNQTFLIVYSTIPAQNLYVNITSAYMLNTQLADSNMIKFLFHCNNQFCLWNNNFANMQLVYINPDTRIFKIIYNESNPAVAAVNYPRSPI